MRNRSRMQEHIVPTPQGIDAVLISIASYLKLSLHWLDDCYALSRIIRDRNGDRILATYAGGNEYIDLMPAGGLGNYIALRLQSSETENDAAHQIGFLRRDMLRIDLIAFFDFRSLGNQDSLTESIVAEEIKAALKSMELVGLLVLVDSYFVDPEDVFSPADLNLTDPVLLRRPYGCISLSLKVIADQQFYCQLPSQN